ncbi:MAG: hypothetical protein KDC98_19855 [Planctomycetes bacterium]|nr:hypothetical protein [Planctomycetota bacterium]
MKEPRLAAAMPPRIAALIAIAGVGAGACAGPGPATVIANPQQHRCFLDGVQQQRRHVPFRFYGTSRIDVVPADVRGRPDWSRRPGSIAVQLSPPVSPWLFPLDFFAEIYERTANGPGDATVTVAAEPIAPEMQIDPEARPAGIDELNQRAHAARIAR